MFSNFVHFARYVKSFPGKLMKLLKEAEISAKVLVFAQVLAEQADGVYTLKRCATFLSQHFAIDF